MFAVSDWYPNAELAILPAVEAAKAPEPKAELSAVADVDGKEPDPKKYLLDLEPRNQRYFF